MITSVTKYGMEIGAEKNGNKKQKENRQFSWNSRVKCSDKQMSFNVVGKMIAKYMKSKKELKCQNAAARITLPKLDPDWKHLKN